MCRSKCKYSHRGNCLITNGNVPNDALCYIGQTEIQERFGGEGHALKKRDRNIMDYNGISGHAYSM